MAELKRVFSKGIMNKDLDERLVPNGQYRDALNIQIATSDGDDVGSAQTIMGNTVSTAMNNPYEGAGVYDVPEGSYCVGSIASRSKDKIYYFVESSPATQLEKTQAKDYILEYDAVRGLHKYVFVDIHSVKTTVEAATGNADNFLKVTNPTSYDSAAASVNKTGIRVGMFVGGTLGGTTYEAGDGITVARIKWSYGDQYRVDMELDGVPFQPPQGVLVGDKLHFTAPRVLKFSKLNPISAINILDDFLLWTDNENEPRKLNIPRSIAGTGGVLSLANPATPEWYSRRFDGDTAYFHTRLALKTTGESPSLKVEYRSNLNFDVKFRYPIYVDEKYITTIKKSPTQPLALKMYSSGDERVNTITGALNPSSTTLSNHAFALGTQTLTLDSAADFRQNDILLFANQDNTTLASSFTNHDVRARVTSSTSSGLPNNLTNSLVFTVEIESMPGSTTSAEVDYYVRREDPDPMFEFKFPRFSYRYKYHDGEYSTFAPWSEIAFLPSEYEYLPKKGYNFGMVNQIRSLKLTNYFGSLDVMPQDITEIDLLYKETNNGTVYTVKTIKPSDGKVMWPNEEELREGERGSFQLDTDMVHAVVQSNQILRPWDNVPRKALAQEVSANRLMYGNYTQNYNVPHSPRIGVALNSLAVQSAAPSVKSQRTYQVGLVYSDGYGRETPVLTNESASARVPKTMSNKKNKLSVQLDAHAYSPPTWAKYMSWYIKESSVEYYTLSMDRWYDAWDGNVWLSFPSADRSKINDETFLELKKEHGQSSPVLSKARYKVLAIESEAPDFIKITKKLLGHINNGNTANAIGSEGGGYPIPDTTTVTIHENSFESAFGGDFLTITKDNLSLILFGDGVQSLEYNVVSVSHTGSYYTLTIAGKFGDDVSFTSTNNSFLSAIESLSISLFENNVENKPEFDGRFFVKIFKDPLLQASVLTESDIDYTISHALPLSYLNNAGYEASTYTHWDGYPVGDDSASLGHQQIGTCLKGCQMKRSSFREAYRADVDHTTKHPTEYTFHTDATEADGGWNEYGQGQPVYRWGNGNGDMDFSSSSHGVKCGHIKDNPIRAINDSDHYGNDRARNFWLGMAENHRFFIDACTVYSYNGRDENRPGRLGEGHHGQWGSFHGSDDNENDGWYGGDSSQEDADDEDIWGVDGGGDSSGLGLGGGVGGKYSGNMGSMMGQPSRGIWETTNTKSYMDISWSGMMNTVWDEQNEAPNNLSGLVMKLGDHPPENTAHVQGGEFIEKLVTPGTKWRFKRCPDKQIYTTTAEHPFPTAYRSVRANTDAGGATNWTQGGSAFTGMVNWQADFLGHDAPVISQQGYNSPSYQAWDGGSYGGHGLGATNRFSGVFGMRNFQRGEDRDAQFWGINLRQRWTITCMPGIGANGGAGYSPIHGTKSPEVGGPDRYSPDYRRAIHHDGAGGPYGETEGIGTDVASNDHIYLLEPFYTNLDGTTSANWTQNPAVWETEPKESVELDIYYQASPLIPLKLSTKTNEEYIPLGSIVRPTSGTVKQYITEWVSADTFKIALSSSLTDNQELEIIRPDGHIAHIRVDGAVSANGSTPVKVKVHGGFTTDEVGKLLYSQKHFLAWNNCWSFGNGVESDRIRDDFNAPQMDNGVKASTVLPGEVKEEHRKHGIIWSGIYNSNVGVNDTNQFIAAEKITKDLNPSYGSIQALLNRDTRLIMFCEDKILRGVTNKDALYNADGNPQLVASNKVVGDTTPYQGDFGVSTHPESIVATPYQVYFTDKARGQVLALSAEGVRSISDLGMKNYFATLMSKTVWKTLGTYDERKNEYNLTVTNKHDHMQSEVTEGDSVTVSYSEKTKGWTSFKSFIPQDGLSINNDYYTFDDGRIYQHHSNTLRNNFYGKQYSSDVTVLFNDTPNSIKNFTAINYEGSQAKVSAFNDETVNWYSGVYDDDSSGYVAQTGVNDGQFFNLSGQAGWYASNVETNLQKCSDIEFVDKEGKWYGFPAGEAMGGGDAAIPEQSEGESTVQGLGLSFVDHSGDDEGGGNEITFQVGNATWDNAAAQFLDDYGGYWDDIIDAFAETPWSSAPFIGVTVIAGATIGSNETSDIILSIAPEAGTPLNADYFSIGNQSDLSSGNVSLIDEFSNVVDWSLIESVEFINNGNINELTNTVTARVKWREGSVWPASIPTQFIDIDHSQGVGTLTRKACIKTSYKPHIAALQATPVINAVDDITASTQTAYVATAGYWAVNSHEGTVPVDYNGASPLATNEPRKIASITFATANDAWYDDYSVRWEDGVIGDSWDMSSYSSQVENILMGTGDNSWKTVGFTMDIYYEPSSSGPADPADFCNLGHKVYIDVDILTPTVVPGGGDDGDHYIHKVDRSPKNYTAMGGEGLITVVGTQGSPYEIYLEKKQATNSTITAATGGYYNFITGSFQDGPISPQLTSTVGIAATTEIGASNISYHPISLPPVEVETRYDITISSATSVFSNLCPVLDLLGAPVVSITQRGLTTVVVGGDGTHSGNGVVEDSIIREFNPGSTYSKDKAAYATICARVAGAHSAGTVKIALNKEVKKVKPGMYVVNPFGQTAQTNAIQHLSKVVYVNGNLVTIDKALQAPGLSNDAEICFLSNNNTVKPISVKVTKGASEANITAIETGVSWKDMVGGISTVNRAIDVADGSVATGGVDIDLKGTGGELGVFGVVPGMIMTGPGVVGQDGSNFVTVVSVEPGSGYNSLVVDSPYLTLPQDTLVKFSYADGGGTGMELLHLQAHIETTNTVALIQGYIRVDRLKTNATLKVYSGNILTQS